MVCRAEVQLDFHCFEDLLPQGTGEDCVSICHNAYWRPMELKDVVHEGLGNCVGRIGMCERNKMSSFSKSVHDNKYYFLSLRFRQSFNEVHCNVLPGHIRWVQWFKESRVLTVL